MDFKKWLQLQEVGTGTSCIAGFARMTLPMIRRSQLGPWGEEDPFFKKKKGGKKKDQLIRGFNEGEGGSPQPNPPQKQFTGWKPDRVKWWANYAANHLFKSPEEAREWVFQRMQYADRQPHVSMFGGPDGEAYNRAAADSIPVYQSGKSFKVGQRIRKDYRLKWEQIELRMPDWEDIVMTAQSCDTREFTVHKPQLVPIRLLLGDDTGDAYSHGREADYIKSLALQIKTNLWFEPILYDFNEPYIMEGQHRVRAARVLGFTKVPGIGIEYHD